MAQPPPAVQSPNGEAALTREITFTPARAWGWDEAEVPADLSSIPAVRMHEVVREHKLDLLHCHYAIPHATSAVDVRASAELAPGGRHARVALARLSYVGQPQLIGAART